MRQFAWYSPELELIILQTIMDDCTISFECDINDIGEAINYFGGEFSVSDCLWMPLGEI